MKNNKVVIVGAGLTGLSCAYHVLQDQPDADVTVLEAGALACGASGRTTGMVTPGIGQDFAGLIRRVGLQRAAALYKETREAVHYVGELVAAEGIECHHELVGQLVVAHGAEGEARLERQAAALEAAGQPCTRLDPEGLAQRVRFDPSGAVELAALYLPDAALVDPVMLVQGLARAIESRGAKIQCDTRVLGVSRGAHPTLRLEGSETIEADKVVLATASESPDLAKLSGRIIPIRLKVLVTEPLTAVQLAALGWRNRECIIDSRRLFNYFRLTWDNRIVFGGGVPEYGAPADSAPEFDDLEHELAWTFPYSESLSIARRWEGTIDYTLDGLPVVGPVDRSGNVLYAGGFCGHGVALGVRSGRWVADLLARRSHRPHPALRSSAPLIPGEWLRKACFSIASSWMRLREV